MKKIFIVFSLTLILFKVQAQVNLASSLTACYSLDGNAPEPVNALTGTLSSITSTVDRNGNSNSACYFSGSTSSYIMLPNSSFLKPTEITFAAWISAKTLTANVMDIVFTKNTFSSYFAAYCFATEHVGPAVKISLYRQNGGGDDVISSTTTITTNTWYHVAFSLNSTSMKLYVNGVLEASAIPAITSFNYDGAKEVILGGTNESYNDPFIGSMDNVRFYNRILTAAEVSALYSQDPTCAVPTCSFSISPSAVCAGKTFSLTDLSSAVPNSWTWQTSGATSSSATIQNPVVTYTASGTYTISLVATNTIGAGFATTKTVTVYANPLASITPITSSVICAGQTTTLTATGGSAYLWNGTYATPQLTVGTVSQSTNNAAQTSTYNVVVTSVNGCTSSATFTLLTIPLPFVQALGANTVCAGSVSSLSLATTALNYTWSTGANSNTTTIQPNVSTTYSVIVKDAQGCVNTASYNVAVLPVPALQIIGNTVICQGLPTTLLASGSAATYTWSNNSVGSLISITPSVTTVYAVFGAGINGCISSASQTIVVNPLPVLSINANTTTVCEGQSVILNASGAPTYSWTNGILNNVAFNPTLTAIYTVTGSNSNGCHADATIQITVLPTPTLSYVATTTQANCPGEAITIQAGGAVSYTWSTGEVGASVVEAPFVTTTYTMMGMGLNGCTNTISITLIVNTCVGLESFAKQNLTKIYPNPSSGKFVIEVGNSEIKTYSVVNVLGAEVLKGSTQEVKSTLDLSAFQNGIYFLRIGEGANSEIVKIVKE